jgi:hypothetical protein
VVFGDKILLKRAEYYIEDDNLKVKFIFNCIAEMDLDYRIWLHAHPKDLNLLNDNRIGNGFANLDHYLKSDTSKWIVGNEYIHEYDINLKNGVYFFKFGFWNTKNNEGNVKRLYLDNQSYSYELGEIDFMDNIIYNEPKNLYRQTVKNKLDYRYEKTKKIYSKGEGKNCS